MGSNLIEHYLPQGYEFCVIDNFATGKREVLPRHPLLRVAEGSIADEALVDRTFSEFAPTHVIHSAAAYKDPQDWSEDVRTNVLGSINVAKASQKAQVRRVINFQTGLCYGNPEIVPIPVSHPLRPVSSYAISKTAGETYLMQSGLNVVSLRLASVIAPRLVVGAIPTFYQRLKAGKPCYCSDTVRDFIDIDDFLRLMDLVMDAQSPQGIFNVSDGKGHAIKEIFDLVVEFLAVKLESPPPIVPPSLEDVARLTLDPKETYEVLGWNSIIDFKSSIRKMLDWYELHGVSEVYSHIKKSE